MLLPSILLSRANRPNKAELVPECGLEAFVKAQISGLLESEQ